MQVIIDNITVYDQWHSGKSGDSYGGEFTADLSAGNHNITVKVYESKGAAKWWLKWYVEPDEDNETEEGEFGPYNNHKATTDTDGGILTYVRGVELGKGHVVNAEALEDFYPDADVRNPISLGSSNAVLYKYYDRDLQPLAYEETSAPLTAQVFFYLRSTKDGFGNLVNLFEPTDVLEDEMQKGNMYIGFLD
jgi:hypothetical protein